jgi:hypothetical protein
MGTETWVNGAETGGMEALIKQGEQRGSEVLSGTCRCRDRILQKVSVCVRR